MAVNLQKGQKISLTKDNANLNKVMVGLGWDVAEKKGFFGGYDIDCDASAIMLRNGKFEKNKDLVSYMNLKHKSGSVRHMGDNLTGAGDGDDEQILVTLKDVPEKYDRIVFVVNIYQAAHRNQDFSMVKNAFIRLVDQNTKQEICRYNLSENYDGMTAMIFGEVYRNGNEWKFNAMGQATTDNDLDDLTKRFK